MAGLLLAPGSWLHARPAGCLHPRVRLVCCRAAGGDRASVSTPSVDTTSSLESLDSLLGVGEPERDPSLVEWWKVRPRQAAPPRTTTTSASSGPGRFIANEDVLRNNVQVGRSTADGQAIELPKVQPYLSYVLAAVLVAVYGTLARVSQTQGADAAADVLRDVGLSRTHVLEQGEAWRMLSGMFVHAELAPLAVAVLGLLVVAPRVEASLGHRTFATALLLSGVASADAYLLAHGGGGSAATTAAAASTAASTAAGVPGALADALLHPAGQALVSSGDAALGALGVLMGVAGCASAHHVLNAEVEVLARQGPTSGPDASASASTSGRQRGGVDVAAAALAAGCVAAAAAQADGLAEGAALVAALGAGFAVGFVLTLTAGPRYQVQREADIPLGAMWVPDVEAVEEMTVVLDQTTPLQRAIATGIAITLTAAGTLTVLAVAR